MNIQRYKPLAGVPKFYKCKVRGHRRVCGAAGGLLLLLRRRAQFFFFFCFSRSARAFSFSKKSMGFETLVARGLEGPACATTVCGRRVACLRVR